MRAPVLLFAALALIATAFPVAPAARAGGEETAATPASIRARLAAERLASAKEAAAAGKVLAAQWTQAQKAKKEGGSIVGACALRRLAILLDPDNPDARAGLGYLRAADGWGRNDGVRTDLADAVLQEGAVYSQAGRKRVALLQRAAGGRLVAIARDAEAARAKAAEADRPAWTGAAQAAWAALLLVDPGHNQAHESLGHAVVGGIRYSPAVVNVVANRAAREERMLAILAGREALETVPVPAPMQLRGVSMAAAGTPDISVCGAFGLEWARQATLAGVRAWRIAVAMTGAASIARRGGKPYQIWCAPDLGAARQVIAAAGVADEPAVLADIDRYASITILPHVVLTRNAARADAMDSVGLYCANMAAGQRSSAEAPWMSEGIIIAARLRVIGRCTAYFSGASATDDDRDLAEAADWFQRARLLVETDTDPPFTSLVRRPRSALRTPEVTKAYGLIEYLLERDERQAQRFQADVMRDPTADALDSHFGMTLSAADDAYRLWVLESH